VKNKTARQEKATKIVKAAARLFGSKGYLDTAMRDIVTASQASKGAIYHYFSQKEDILFEVLDSYMDLVLQNLEAELLPLPSGDARLKYTIDRHIALYVNNIYAAKTLLHEARHLPAEKFALIAAKQREYFRIVSQVLLECAPYGVDASQLTAITFTLFGMCNWIYSWYNPEKAVNAAELSNIIFKIFTRGVSQTWQRNTD
jgi:AcrR family transcriptional regulator